MSEKVRIKNAAYQVREWDVASFVEACGTIIAANGHNIHRIRLNKRKEVYLVPQAVYLAATDCLKKAMGSEEAENSEEAI